MPTFTTLSRWLLVLLVTLIAVGPGVGIASAAERGNAANRALEKAYAREQKNLINLRARLDKAALRATRVATWIDQAKGRGKDTTALETALQAFRSQIGTAEKTWSEAKSILDTHAGFDASGKVTDATAAKATVENATGKLQETRTTLRDAYVALRKAVADWRKANRDIPDPKVPAEE